MARTKALLVLLLMPAALAPQDDQLDAVLGRGMPAQSSQPIGIDAMQKLADETGGRAFVNTNDLTGTIRHAVEDFTATYTLGFYIDSDSSTGISMN